MISRKSDENSIVQCASVLKNGGIVILPTDTVYGFSGITEKKYDCDKKIRIIKGREESKPMIQLISSPEEIFKYTDDLIPSKLFNFWPGPLTIIVKNKILSQRDNIVTTAFRCPGDKWLRDVIKSCGSTIFSTSVNRSGKPVLDEEKTIIKEFEKEVDLIVTDGDKKESIPSTIVSLTDGNIKILRQGAVTLDI